MRRAQYEASLRAARMTTSDLLDQDQVWRTGDGLLLPLTDMEPSHRANTLAWLRRRASALREAALWCEFRIMASCPDDGVFDQWIAECDHMIDDDPAAWLERRPLVVALARLVADDTRGPVIDVEVVVREIEGAAPAVSGGEPR